MANVKLAYRNILETATVTSTDENSSFPLYRTYDRDIGKLFKFNSHAANLYVAIDQGAVISYEVDRLIIPASHSLNGETIKLQYSTTGAWAGEEVDALSWTQGDALIINKNFTAQTKRYWRLLITSDPAAALEMPEIYLTKDYEFETNVRIILQEESRRNIERDETISGYPRWVKLGEDKEYRDYDLIVDATQKASLQSWWSVMDSVKPFYVYDHNGSWYFMEALNDLSFQSLGNSLWSINLQLLEVL
jgi:hypothetical protein